MPTEPEIAPNEFLTPLPPPGRRTRAFGSLCQEVWESELFRVFRHTIPSCWWLHPSLAGFDLSAMFVEVIKNLDRRSDEIVRALITLGRDDPVVVTVIVVALLLLLLARCAHDRDRVDELVGELAIVISEFDSRDFSRWPAKAASRLLDRAWGRVRVPARRRVGCSTSPRRRTIEGDE